VGCQGKRGARRRVGMRLSGRDVTWVQPKAVEGGAALRSLSWLVVAALLAEDWGINGDDVVFEKILCD